MSHGSPDIVVVGEVNVDLILDDVNMLPELGKERIATGMTLTMGSSSAILAANAAALGVSVGFVGRVGKDSFGSFMRERLEARGVDVSHMIETPDGGTGLTAIYTYHGQRGMLTYPGVMERLTIDDIPWAYVEQASHLHLSSYYLQRGIRPDCARLFRMAKERGLTTSLDTNWDPDETWGAEVLDVLDHVDVFLPNDDEARLIAGTSDVEEAMRILAAHAGTVVVTLGAEGVAARRGEETFRIPAIRLEPVDAVGAGDTFNAGFLSRYIAGDSLEACLAFGVLTGAFSTQAAGGTAAFDDIQRFDRFVQEHGSRNEAAVAP